MSARLTDGVQRARDGAIEWLSDHDDGYPRSHEQEGRNAASRGYELYDDFEAPPIAGYETLENDGFVERLGVVLKGDEERVHFRITPAGREALKGIE